MSADLHEVISESVEDAELPPEPVSDPGDGVDAPAPIQEPEPSQDAPSAPDAPTEPAKLPPDEFEVKFGIPAQSLSGRENRIPYTRVKKITEKAVLDAKKEWETTYEPQIAEFETKVRDYEERLDRVARFEDVMINKPDQFLDMLSRVPAYEPFFRAIEQAIANAQSGGAPHVPAADQMPEPDQDLADGTKVYSMEGLKALLAWQANQVENKVTRQVEARYKPLESNYEAQQRYYAQQQLHSEVLGKVQTDIADARTWPQFNENEAEIVKALQTYPQLSLEGAYRHVVFPKIVADRNKIREEVLRDVKQAPRSTSAPSSTFRSVQPTPAGARNLEDVIADAVKTIK